MYNGAVPRCSGSPDEQGQPHSNPLHFLGDMNHFLQGGCDEARQTNYVCRGKNQSCIPRSHTMKDADRAILCDLLMTKKNHIKLIPDVPLLGAWMPGTKIRFGTTVLGTLQSWLYCRGLCGQEHQTLGLLMLYTSRRCNKGLCVSPNISTTLRWSSSLV